MFGFLIIAAIIYIVYKLVGPGKNGTGFARKFDKLTRERGYEIFFKMGIKVGIAGLDETQRVMCFIRKPNTNDLIVLRASDVRTAGVKQVNVGVVIGVKKTWNIQILTNDLRNPTLIIDFYDKESCEDFYNRIAILFNLR